MSSTFVGPRKFIGGTEWLSISSLFFCLRSKPRHKSEGLRSTSGPWRMKTAPRSASTSPLVLCTEHILLNLVSTTSLPLFSFSSFSFYPASPAIGAGDCVPAGASEQTQAHFAHNPGLFEEETALSCPQPNCAAHACPPWLQGQVRHFGRSLQEETLNRGADILKGPHGIAMARDVSVTAEDRGPSCFFYCRKIAADRSRPPPLLFLLVRPREWKGKGWTWGTYTSGWQRGRKGKVWAVREAHRQRQRNAVLCYGTPVMYKLSFSGFLLCLKQIKTAAPGAVFQRVAN
jgi:hypothetical protein